MQRNGFNLIKAKSAIFTFLSKFIDGSMIFFRGGLKDEFIRMCIDCIAVKTQLLR